MTSASFLRNPMITDEDIQIYGAKGAVLDYIRSQDKEIPIPPFVLVGVDEDWKKKEKEIMALGGFKSRTQWIFI